jgi:hypothetical protein
VSGDQQYRVRLYKQGTGWNLEVYLEKYAAPELGDAARQAKEISHQINVILRYKPPATAQSPKAGPLRELIFQEVTNERSQLKAVLHLEDLQERDGLIYALETAQSDATMLVRRTLTVKFLPYQEVVEAQMQESVARVRLEGPYSRLGRLKREYRALLDRASETGIHNPAKEKEYETQISDYTRIVGELEIKYEEARANVRTVRTTGGFPLTGTLEITTPRQPFTFDRGLHPYVFAGVNKSPDGNPKFVHEQFLWGDRYYSYFRPADRSDLWYYLPDRFVLAKQGQLPKLTVRFIGPPESQSAELEYIAVPFTDPARIEAARAALGLGTSDPVKLEPLVGGDATLWAALPVSDADGLFQLRAGASVDLRAGLKDQVRLSLEGFRKIYDALFNQSHTLFTGEVRLNPDGVSLERVPFEARVTDLSPGDFWDRAISQQVSADYQRTIQVKTMASVFAGDVKALIVLFKGSDDELELHKDKLEAEVCVRTPMRDFVLNSGGGGEYFYKVTTMRERDGKLQTTKTPTWKTGSDAILYLGVP